MIAAALGTLVAAATSTASAQARQPASVGGVPAAVTLSVSMLPRVGAGFGTDPLGDETATGTAAADAQPAGVRVDRFGAASTAGQPALGGEDSPVLDTHASDRSPDLELPLNVGADGLDWTLAPYISRSWLQRDAKNDTGSIAGSEERSLSRDGKLSGYGMYTGPLVNLRVAQPLTVGLGAGIELVYMFHEAYAYTGDVTARVPFSASYALCDDLTLVIETGFGYDVRGFIDDSAAAMNDRVVGEGYGRARGPNQEPRFVDAFGWDFTISMSLP